MVCVCAGGYNLSVHYSGYSSFYNIMLFSTNVISFLVDYIMVSSVFFFFMPGVRILQKRARLFKISLIDNAPGDPVNDYKTGGVEGLSYRRILYLSFRTLIRGGALDHLNATTHGSRCRELCRVWTRTLIKRNIMRKKN